MELTDLTNQLEQVKADRNKLLDKVEEYINEVKYWKEKFKDLDIQNDELEDAYRELNEAFDEYCDTATVDNLKDKVDTLQNEKKAYKQLYVNCISERNMWKNRYEKAIGQDHWRTTTSLDYDINSLYPIIDNSNTLNRYITEKEEEISLIKDDLETSNKILINMFNVFRARKKTIQKQMFEIREKQNEEAEESERFIQPNQWTELQQALADELASIDDILRGV